VVSARREGLCKTTVAGLVLFNPLVAIPLTPKWIHWQYKGQANCCKNY
jgi:hypothetical protein